MGNLQYAAALLLLLPALDMPLRAQGPQGSQPEITTLRTSTQLVVVNVTVHDRNGKTVRNLPQSSFEVRENNTPEPLRYFMEMAPAPPTEAASSAAAASATPALPPGVFTDLTPDPPQGPLNVLLLDTLNTPLPDQAYLRAQLLDYLRTLKPGTRLAIFGLGSRLYLLQGFTSSPELLRQALEHRVPSPSTLLPVTADSNVSATTGSEAVADSAGTPPPTPGGPAASSQLLDTAAVLSQFEADTEAYQTRQRIQTTVDGFNALAHYLGGLPGRKNLLWFSGSFPLTLLPDPTAGSQATSTFLVNELLRSTATLLSRAQVAVYPIDVRGLLVNPAFDASRSGERYGRSPTAFAQDVTRFQSGLAQEHNTELTVAEQSGGRAFFNTNSLAVAASAAIDDGSSYYVLEYRPSNESADDALRRISVSLNGAAAAAGYTLQYRRGYYSGDTASASHAASPQLSDSADLYARAAMSRGAPAPSEVLFTASVLPASSTPEDTLAPDVKTDPAHAVKPPYRRFHVSFALMPRDLTWVQQPDGDHDGRLAFLAFLYDADGRIVLSNGRDLSFNLSPAKFREMQAQPIRLSFDIDAPLRGESFLRLGVHDLKANRFGVIEISVSALLHSEAVHP